MLGTLRCTHRVVLLASLVFEQTQIGQIVFDFTERDEHLLTILRNVLVILRARIRKTRLATATVEERHRQRRARERSEQERAARPHEEVAERRRLITERTCDIELREECGLTQTDPR